MELRKENSKFPEKLAIELYNLISNYGESVEKSVLWIMLAIFLIPLCALSCNYIVSDRLIASIWIIFSILIWYCYTVENLEKLIPHLIILTVVGYIFSYIFIYLSHMPIMELLRDTITAFFQLSIDDAIIEKTGNYEHFMKNWEGIIRIISLILLGNLYITLRRRLSRK
jgi:TctA family transporter